MIQAQLDPNSTAKVIDYFEATRTKILAAVREGMTQAVDLLDEIVLSKLGGNPITSRSGALAQAVANGKRVRENSNEIIGSIVPDTRDGRNLAQWLEEGHRLPGQRMRKFEAGQIGKSAFSADDIRKYISGSRVPAHPFLNPSLEESEPLIMQIIAQKVADAVE